MATSPTFRRAGRGDQPMIAVNGCVDSCRPSLAETDLRPSVAASFQPWGWAMLTIQATPNWSSHMPNSSPHICFSSGTETLPPADSFSQ